MGVARRRAGDERERDVQALVGHAVRGGGRRRGGGRCRRRGRHHDALHAGEVARRFGQDARGACQGVVVEFVAVQVERRRAVRRPGDGVGRHAVVVVERAPGEDGVVVGPLDDLLLQPQEGVLALAVEDGHADAEEPHERVGDVLDPGGAPVGGPGHALGDAGVVDEARVEQGQLVDPRHLGDGLGQRRLGPQEAPPLGVEDDAARGQQLLQGPAAREPAAAAEVVLPGPVALGVVVHVHVLEVGVAHGRLLVPRVHGVDGLGHLGAALLVDAARVDPDVVVAILGRLAAGVRDLGVPGLELERMGWRRR